MNMIPALLAMQAAGMVVDYLGTAHSINIARKGYELQQQAIEKSIQLSRLQTEDESLQSLISLRKNLGSQAVMLAARGVSGSSGIGAIAMTESVSNFNMDEKMRRINQEVTESKLRSNKEASKLQFQSFKGNRWSAFATRTANRFPTSPAAYNQLAKNFGLTEVEG
jgi:hypothetical protein